MSISVIERAGRALRALRRRRAGSRGIALLLTVWVLALVATIAVNITRETSEGARLTRNLVEAAQARALAEGGVWRTLYDLRTGAAGPIPVDGTPRPLDADSGALSVAVRDEVGKLDLNAATAAQFERLLLALELAPEAARRLAVGLEAFRGHARAVQRRAGQGDAAKSPPFLTVGELRLVDGVTVDIFSLVRPHVTVWSGNSRVDAEAATRALLLSLPDTDAASVDQVIARRGTAAAQGRLPGRNVRIVTITATARLASGAVSVCEASVDLHPRDGAPFRILAWSGR